LLKGIDAHKVAVDWNVPPQWQPTATVDTTFTFSGTPGKSQIKYEARAPSMSIPGMAGYDVQLTKPRIVGALLAINADVSASFLPERVVFGGMDLGKLPWGMSWYKEKLLVSAANTKIWNGDNDVSLTYTPAEYPAFSIVGQLVSADAAAMARTFLPKLGLAVEGTGATAYAITRDAAGALEWIVHGSVSVGSISNYDLYSRAIEALGDADPAIRVGELAAMLPQPRHGEGTRVDRFYFEADRKGDVYTIGGLLLRGEDFRFDADGEYSDAAGLRLDGTFAVPQAAAEKLTASASWLSALRSSDGAMYVPIVITGKPADPTVALAPGFADTLARAKRSEPVTAPVRKLPRHVGQKLGTIPGDPGIVD